MFPLFESYGQELNINIEKKIFNIGDDLRVFGTSVPEDALIAELYNPKGELVLRTQLDVGADGTFSETILQWSLPTEKFPFGIYSLVVKSSIDEERRATEVLKFQGAAELAPLEVARELAAHLSVPEVIGRNETARIIVQVTVNDVLFKGDPEETLKDSHIHFPDGSIRPITFSVLEDGIYFTEFRSRLLGHHTIHIEAFQYGLIANTVSDVLVQDDPILSLKDEVSRLNANMESLREETVQKTGDIADAVSKIGSAAGQVTSLLLPIIGMIAIIVALQATILAKRSKPDKNQVT